MQSRTWVDITAIAVTIMIVLVSATLYVTQRTGPRDALTARTLVGEHTRALAERLRLRTEHVRGRADTVAWASTECGVWQGDRKLTAGRHLQQRVRYTAQPPPRRAATALAPEAEAVLRELGYRITTSEVNFATAPPPGIVLAKWGDTIEVTLWPDPRAGTVDITGSTRCLPAA